MCLCVDGSNCVCYLMRFCAFNHEVCTEVNSSTLGDATEEMQFKGRNSDTVKLFRHWRQVVSG